MDTEASINLWATDGEIAIQLEGLDSTVISYTTPEQARKIAKHLLNLAEWTDNYDFSLPEKPTLTLVD